MSCSVCKRFKENSNVHCTIYSRSGTWLHSETVLSVDFCPVCGEPLTDQKPLTLDELRKMDGEPVWRVDTWYLVWVDDNGEVYLQKPKNLGEPSDKYGCLRECLVYCPNDIMSVKTYRYPQKEATKCT